MPRPTIAAADPSRATVRRVAALLAACLLPWSMLPWSAALADTASPTLERIRKAGVVKLGYRADARPYSYRDEKGRAAGYIVNLCREVASDIAAAMRSKVRTDYVLVPASARFEAVRDGHIDILCDPSSVSLERRELVDFSIPTFLDGASALSRSNRPIARFEDLKGLRVGVLAGTTTAESLRGALSDLRIKSDIVTVDDHYDGVDLLTADRIDVYFADRAIIASMMHHRRMPGFQLSKQYFSYETYALALPRDDSAFRLLVDRTLARLYRTGRIETIMAKSFGANLQDDMLKAMVLINSLPER